MDKSLKDPGAEAFLKQIRETKATAASPAIPSEPAQNLPSITEPESAKSTAKTDDGGTGGGKGGPGSPGGGDGKGSNSSENDPFFTRSDMKLLMYVAIFFIAIGLYMFSNMLVADHFSAAPKPIQPQKVVNPTSAPSQPVSDISTTVVYGSMFNCSTPEERDVGIANAHLQQFGQGSSLHLTSGCALFQVDTAVNKFNADKYQLLVAVEEISANDYRNDVYSGKYYKCGNTGGNMETVSLCREFLDKYRGRPVLVLIKNGGYANIN